MSLGKHAGFSLFAALVSFLASCGGGGSGSSGNSIVSIVQDLDLGPNGDVTVVTFGGASGIEGVTTGTFEADGGQTPVSVDVAGSMVTITWDARVSPASQVRALGIGGIGEGFHAVETSNGSPPTFEVTDAVQNAGLGNDTITIQFSGPRLVESESEVPANWTLTVDDTELDLTGATLDLDVATQELSVTLGAAASLYASFELTAHGLHSVANVLVDSGAVVGAAAGDSTAPSLLSAEQNLSEDEFGRVIDFQFDEDMNPTFAVQLAHFDASPNVATSVEQIASDTLRVSFNQPIVPGYDTVAFLELPDLHGNTLDDPAVSISQSAPVANSFDAGTEVTTVEGSENDLITVVTTQAFQPSAAEDPTAWLVEVDALPIDVSSSNFLYDLESKTLVIALDQDLPNGSSWDITALFVVDVDGEAFLDTVSGTVSGDATAPTVSGVVQNRSVEAGGTTLDVQFSEDVDLTTCEDTGNYAVGGSPNLISATRLASGDSVRLVFDGLVVPGSDTLDLDNVTDVAGNALVTVTGMTIGSTDATAPNAIVLAAVGVEGSDDDTLAITFDDDMIESEVEDPANWTVEVPAGTPVVLTGCTIVWSGTHDRATLTFANGYSFQQGATVQAGFGTMRDLGGNTISATTVSGTVDVESTRPEFVNAYYDSSAADEVVLHFSEPCAHADDLYDVSVNPTGTRYMLRTAGGSPRGMPTAATSIEGGLAVRLEFGLVVDSTDTIDAYGVTDMAGNPLFPVLAAALEAEDLVGPDLDGPSCTASVTSGENNDVVEFVFDRQLNPWRLLRSANYGLTDLTPTALDIAAATLTFDGDRTVSAEMRAGSAINMVATWVYILYFTNILSAQGTTASGDSGIVTATGDSSSPSVASDKVRLQASDANSVLIECSEALGESYVENAAHYDRNSGDIAMSATLVSPRVVSVQFSGAVSAGDAIEFTVADLATNASGVITRTVAAADSTAPLIASVSGLITPSWGGDEVHVTFDEPVGSASALLTSQYTVTTGSTALILAGARLTYVSGSNTVRIRLAGGQELQSGAALTVQVSSVSDVSGNTMPSTVTTGGSTSGDTTAPMFSGAFVNWRDDASGATVELIFDEDVSSSFASSTANWTVGGGLSVSGASLVERDRVRLTLSAPLPASTAVGISALPDLAGNASGSLSITPER